MGTVCSNMPSIPSMPRLPRRCFGAPKTWDDLKQEILDAIKNDDSPDVFERLLTEVQDFMTEIKEDGKLSDISIELQEDSAVFF